MVDRLTKRSSQLHMNPFSGQVVPEFGDETIREVIEGPFRIIYQSFVTVIYVLAVVHGARILTKESLRDQG